MTVKSNRKGEETALTCAEAGLDAGEDEEEEGDEEEEEEEEEVKAGRIADVRMSCRRRKSRQEVRKGDKRK